MIKQLLEILAPKVTGDKELERDAVGSEEIAGKKARTIMFPVFKS